MTPDRSYLWFDLGTGAKWAREVTSLDQAGPSSQCNRLNPRAHAPYHTIHYHASELPRDIVIYPTADQHQVVTRLSRQCDSHSWDMSTTMPCWRATATPPSPEHGQVAESTTTMCRPCTAHVPVKKTQHPWKRKQSKTAKLLALQPQPRPEPG